MVELDIPVDDTHSIINKPPKPAWLKDLAVIDMGLYRRFLPSEAHIFCWRERWSDLRGIDFSTTSSIREKDTKLAHLLVLPQSCVYARMQQQLWPSPKSEAPVTTGKHAQYQLEQKIRMATFARAADVWSVPR